MLATLETTAALSTSYLGPARVLAAGGNRAKLQLPDRCAWAIVALGVPYQPTVDDLVLAIGHSDAWYVIGVIEGRGETRLTVKGDLAICAPRGRIELTAAKGIAVKSPDVTIAANRLELFACTAFERFTHVTRWVKEAFQLRAGRVRTRVDGAYDLAAERILERAQKDVSINGSKINLG